LIRRKGGAVPGGQGTAARLPARSGPRSYKDRPCKRNAGQRPRWTDAGRGLWPPAGHGAAWRSGKGNRLCHGSGVRPFAPVSGRGKRDPRFPRPRGTIPCRPAGPGTPQASARPGGREAPAMGGSGAGRGLWPPAGQGTAQRCGRGDGPCHWNGESACATPGGSGYATRVSPARARRCPVDRQVRDQQKASACRGRVGCWPGALAPGWS